MTTKIEILEQRIRDCRLCATQFRASATAHAPRPVPWLSSNASILIAGQAPGNRVHESGRPFSDPSGMRLRKWLGVNEAQFYDRNCFAFLPMAFCFLGYSRSGTDLPPPRICAQTWRKRVLTAMPGFPLSILAGAAAQRWHLPEGSGSVTETVRRWREFFPTRIPIPHPSWRNNAWLKKNPWFESELVPELQNRVSDLLETRQHARDWANTSRHPTHRTE